MTLVPYSNRTLGATVTIQVPATLEDLVASSNPANVRYAAIKHSLYQGWNNKFRKAIVAKLVEALSFPIPSTGKQKSNRKGETIEILITEADYIKLILNGKGTAGEADYQAPLISETDYFVFAQQVADTIPFEVSKEEEESEPDAKFYTLAKRILAMADAGSIGSDGQPITPEGFAAKWSQANPGYNFDTIGGFTEDGLARALEIDDKRRSLELPVGLV